MVSQKEHELVIFSDGTLIVIKEVFGEQKTNYNHIELISTDRVSSWTNNIADLTAKCRQVQ